MRILFIIISLFCAQNLYSQGYLMLAGGGGESAGGWSDAPYRWVIEKSTNKRVAVLTYDNSATDWIPNYFRSFGAVMAKNFIVANRTQANQQALYDSLITYSAVFIKGGDQAKYYEYYKGTKTQEALQNIYNKGGVLSGTSAGTAILSPIVYTAQVASVDPSTTLLNAYSSQITLADDFLKTLSGHNYIFDTHFIERGRFGRLPAFMATWYKNKGVNTIGIGVDDHTALCIDTTGIARVFGTGAVSFMFSTDPENSFDKNAEMLKSSKLRFYQLLQGSSVSLKTNTVTGLARKTIFPVTEERSSSKVYFCGTDYPSEEAFTYFINTAGNKSDAIAIITGIDVSRANDIRLKLKDNGATNVEVVQAIAGKENDVAIQTALAKVSKLVFVATDYLTLTDFLKSGGNGALLNNKLRQSITFFVGHNARYAGRTVINKYTGSGAASYNGNLDFTPGLGLLNITSIMPYSFVTVADYENTVSGIPYAMLRDSLKYGIYITGNTFAEYNITATKTSYFKMISGSFPLIYLKNESVNGGLANQGPNSKSRNIAGFDSMELRFMGINDTVHVGKNVLLSSNIKPPPQIQIRTIPNEKAIRIYAPQGRYQLKVYEPTGRLVFDSIFDSEYNLDTSQFTSGIVLIQIADLDSNGFYNEKIVIGSNK